ncbi:MAG: hypothetical protein IPJ04_04880 [Candidatus Eisenbacteria bacterium]|nr:hypothetical protein [Candidatus Eisenbacteria bacterium]
MREPVQEVALPPTSTLQLVGWNWLYSKEEPHPWQRTPVMPSFGRSCSWNSWQCRPSRLAWSSTVCGEHSLARAIWRGTNTSAAVEGRRGVPGASQ